MTKISHNDQVRAQLVELGVSEEVANRVNAFAVVEDDGTVFSEVIEMGYPVTKKGATRLKLTAISGSGEGGIAAKLADKKSLATFLDSAMRATPAAQQLALPAWVSENSSATQNAALMARAKGIARATAESQAALAAA